MQTTIQTLTPPQCNKETLAIGEVAILDVGKRAHVLIWDGRKPNYHRNPEAIDGGWEPAEAAHQAATLCGAESN